MELPPELYRLIIRSATWVPGALDTSYEAILHEDREAIFIAIRDSMDVKRSLCLVSKTFYDLTEQYLYEIITFYRYKHIPLVVQSLNTSSHPDRKPPGRWCKRLDIFLGDVDGRDYHGEDWDGSDILWGLIPACPDVTVFLFHGWYMTQSIRMCTKRGLDSPLVPSVALWQIMATNWASSLRRIEMSGIWMRADRFELFIRYFRNLCACRITTVEPFYPDFQLFDEDQEPTYRFAKKFRRGCRIPVGTQYMGIDAVSKLHLYKKIAAWPHYDGERPYTLPSLHTLHLDEFPHLLSHFYLPNVRFLGAYDLMHLGNRRHSFNSAFAHIASTFSSSLTRFTWGSESPINFRQVFDALPYVTDLKIIMHCDFFRDPVIAPLYPQTTLMHMRIIEPSRRSFAGISEIISLVRAGMFPGLKAVSITCRKEQLQVIKDDTHIDELSVTGLSIEMSGTAKFVGWVLPPSPIYP